MPTIEEFNRARAKLRAHGYDGRTCAFPGGCLVQVDCGCECARYSKAGANVRRIDVRGRTVIVEEVRRAR